MGVSAALLADLGASGLKPQDLNARDAGPSELAAVNVSQAVKGIVIPYYDMQGKPIPYYRVKLLDHNPKYKQPTGFGHCVYFPPRFSAALKGNSNLLLLTEGEKKAAAACNAGFPAVGLGGVDSWRTRILKFPKDTKLQSGTKFISAKLDSSSAQLMEDYTLATGMPDLMDFIKSSGTNAIIVFDSDLFGPLEEFGVKPEIQRAAAALGYEMRYRGIEIDKIRQLILPSNGEASKMGLDDFLVRYSKEQLQSLLDKVMGKRSAFPRHPNPRGFVNTKLQKKMSRKEAQSVAMAILSELDAGGRRLRSANTSTPYYFDESTYTLMPAALMQKHGDPLHESAFGGLLYREFGLTATDTRVITWLASQFTGEPPVADVEPQRVLALPRELPDTVALQVSDGSFVLVSSDRKEPIKFMSNGSEGVLFEQNQVDPLDEALVMKHFNKQASRKLKPWWLEVLEPVSMANQQSKELACLLFYISPWLNRWRGTQLPVELMIGEAGSGKSSLYSLRLSILTGRPHLRNMPSDLRDWYASISNNGGIHVIDNVHFTNKELRQRVSDEICRLTTEPNPHIEMRRLYTTTGQAHIPIYLAFAMTAIQQPFFSADLLQRAAVLEIEAIQGSKDSGWVDHQIQKFGGREAWVAHHLLFLHRFMRAVTHAGDWDTEYQSAHRLANYEQALLTAANLFGMSDDWISETLTQTSEGVLSENDWALEGLREFARLCAAGLAHEKPFTANDIASWASAEEDYEGNNQLTNARSLGRYMKAHRNTIMRLACIHPHDKYANRQRFRVDVKGYRKLIGKI